MNAKDMFEKLGYEVITNDKYYLEYRLKNADTCIRFDKSWKCVCKYYYDYDSECERSEEIELEELQAINKQVEELGWNER